MGRLRITIALAVSLIAGVSSCDYVANITNKANEAYHASRWNATIQSCVSGEAYCVPEEPTTPRVCQDIEPIYTQVARKFNATQTTWDELVTQAEGNATFIADMLDGLERKNTDSIEKLAPQIVAYVEQTEFQVAKWRMSLDQTQQVVTELKASWQSVWAENELVFDLEGQVSYRRIHLANTAGELREESLAQFHHNEFSRMAHKYLDYEVKADDIPEKSHLLADCQVVDNAHNALDAALLVRLGLDQAIKKDIELISRLAKVDLSEQAWKEIELPKGRYGEKQVKAAIARLKLLKYLDLLATDSLGIIIREVNLAWEEVWSGHRLETNIFAFAGVEKVGQMQ